MGRLARFLQDYTSGLTGDEVRRLFARDAARTYAVLARDHPAPGEATGRPGRLWARAKIAFLGLSYKLSPARRLLFAVSLVAGLLALLDLRTAGGDAGLAIQAVIYTIVAVGGLVYLLALELADRVLVRDELEVARQLQRDLLPRAAPQLAGYAISHSYRTANEVGGDYYDFPILPGNRVALIAGDASGHGMAAGLVMAIANATIKLALDLDASPPRVADLLNRALCRTGTRRNFMSLFYGLLDLETGRLSYVCAGHPFPLLRRSCGVIEELGTGGFPLGLREPVNLAEAETTLAPGDVLAIFSDGVPECRNPAGEPLGYERVTAQVAAGGSAADVHGRLLAAVDRFRAGEPLLDDLSLVVVERRA